MCGNGVRTGIGPTQVVVAMTILTPRQLFAEVVGTVLRHMHVYANEICMSLDKVQNILGSGSRSRSEINNSTS